MLPTKNIYCILSCAAVLISSQISSCRKGGRCELPLNVKQSEIVVTFKNTNGRYLYTEFNPLCNKDSLKVFDSAGNSLVILRLLRSAPDNPSLGIYVLSFGNIYDQQTDAVSFNSELCKDFIVQYNYNDRDTIKECFKSEVTKCGSVFETLKVYNKGQLLTTIFNNTFADIVVIKN